MRGTARDEAAVARSDNYSVLLFASGVGRSASGANSDRWFNDATMSWKISNEPSESYLTYPEIVAANRSGQITDIQRSILLSDIGTSLTSVLLGLPLLGLGYILLLLPARGTQRDMGLLVIFGLASLNCIGWVIYTLRCG
jgi:hypothetical protein